MNKDQLVSIVAERNGLSKTQSEEIVDSVFDTISESLANKEKVQIVGFGKFYVQERKSRIGRNPQTGEKMDIPVTNLPSFKSGKNLKERVR